MLFDTIAGMRNLLLTLCFLATLATPGRSQNKPGKVGIFVSGSESAAPVAASLIQKMNASKPFEAVSSKEPSNVVVLVSCTPRKATEPFVCLYVSHYNGATFKSFLGAGLFVAKTADEVSDNFLGAIAQDIIERYNDTNIQNLKEGLESCLLMTESKCNVPDVL